MAQRHWERAALDGVELEYEVRGTGEPLVLVHPGIFADWYDVLLAEPALADRFRVVNYHRVGSAGSSHAPVPVSVPQHAAQCRALMRHVGIGRAHVVGHSSGGVVALQLALDASEAVQTLALLEPARPGAAEAEAEAAQFKAVIEPALERYRAGDKAGAVDAFLRGVAGEAYRATLDRVLAKDAFERYAADADSFFGQELPALRQWAFTREDAKRITQPVLAMLGARSKDIFRLRRDVLLAWLPKVEPFQLPDATHLLYLEKPRAVAEGLAAFFARHPLPASA
jgi:pimeloyl-ACP methyl ester carboxylesterase